MTERDIGKCTCVGCPIKEWRILAHVYQEVAWIKQREFIPCIDPECGMNCQRKVTQEDMLCDGCRKNGGISKHNVSEIIRILQIGI